MWGLDNLDGLYVIWAFFFHVILVFHFAIRKWAFSLTRRWGWVVYALCIPAVVISIILLQAGKPWSLWLGGLIYLVWAVFGYTVEYVRHIHWRNPINWRIAGPYLSLYLGTVMFYWWPLGILYRPLWYIAAVLFALSTALNAVSHKGPTS